MRSGQQANRQPDRPPVGAEVAQEPPEQPTVNQVGGNVIGIERTHLASGSSSIPLSPDRTQRQNTNAPNITVYQLIVRRQSRM